MISYSKLRKLKVEIATARDTSDTLDERIEADDSVAFTDLTGTPGSLYQVFYQATAPSDALVNCVTYTVNSGDYWVDSDDNQLYKFDGTDWNSIQDNDISANLVLLQDIASDTKITPVEKQTIKPIWDDIVVEATATTGTLPAAATAAGVADTDFDTAYAALYSQIISTYDVFGTMTTTTTVVRSTWDGVWVDYYDERTKLINAITAAAQADADTGIANAATAQADADTNTAILADIALDSKITPVEKLTIKPIWDDIVTEGTPTTGTIPVRATAAGVSDTAFDTAWGTLNTLLNSTYNVFDSMTTTTTINRTTWDNAWKGYYNARTDLFNAISRNWEHGSDSTKIDGGNVYANTITATEISVSNLSSLNVDAGAITAGTLSSSDWAAAAGIRIDLANKWIKMGGSNVTAAGGAAGVFLGLNTSYKFYVGNGPAGTNYFKWDGTNVEFASNKVDGITIKDGGNIRMEQGGDIYLEPDTANPSYIIFEDSGAGTYHVKFGRGEVNDIIALHPNGTSGVCTFNIGKDVFNNTYAFNNIVALADAAITITVDDAGGNDSFLSLVPSSATLEGDGNGIYITSANVAVYGHLLPLYNDTYTLGGSSNCWSEVFGTAGVTSCSDPKYKTNIKQESLGLDFVNSLVPVSYEWRKDGKRPKNHDGTYHGFIAPEVEAAVEEMGQLPEFFAGVRKDEDDGEIWYGLMYNQLLAPMVKSIQELTEKVAVLEGT